MHCTRSPPISRKHRFVQEIIRLAEDDSYGYSQRPPSGRWGPDFDCTSLIYQAAHNVGYNVGVGGDKIRFSGTMLKDFEKAGFQVLPFANVGVSDLKIGDILLNLALHAEVYVGDDNSVGATSSETGGYVGEAGDQTGHEIEKHPVATWVTSARKIKAIFGSDPEITINYIDGSEPEVKLFVNNPTKADALTKLLPDMMIFGNVSLKITIVPSNVEETFEDLVKRAFAGNPIVSYIENGDGPFGSSICFVAFVNEVIQYFDDRLDDPYGLDSTLAEDICRELFENTEGFGSSVRFCTDLPVVTDVSDAPLGEWP